MPVPDPDERFSLHPEDQEDVLRKVLGVEMDDGETVEAPEEDETDS